MVCVPRSRLRRGGLTHFCINFLVDSEDSNHSGAWVLQVWWQPVFCDARNRGSGDVLCAKRTFFLVQAANINDPSLPAAMLAGFSTMTGKRIRFSFPER